MFFLNIHKQKGQVMLITVLVLMSTFALATAIGGLVLYNLRGLVSIGESTKAIYAAESCLEWKLYNLNGNSAPPTMGNGAEYSVPVATNDSISCVGASGRANRAFEIRF